MSRKFIPTYRRLNPNQLRASMKRSRPGRGGRGAVRRPFKQPRRTFVRGYDRTGGYYGRFAGSGQGEMKFHDTDTDDSVVASAGTIQTGSGGDAGTYLVIPQGITEKTRIGRKCTIKKIFWKYAVSLPEQDAQATPQRGDIVRVIIYQDKQANGATAAVLDILETATWDSFRNLANTGRFHILMDKNHVINYAGLASDGAGLVSQGNAERNFKWAKRCTIPIEWDNSAATGVLTSIRSNNICALFISKNGVAALEGVMRFRFSDGS